MQWNDRYRNDVRGFLRGEAGLVPALQLRIQGSPDLFASPLHSVNFVTCHDGFTLYDLFAYDRKHNDANGWGNHDGSDDNRSWNCGWEGDDGAPQEVVALRRRQLRNAWCLLALSHGVPMVAMGDEFGRTQGGNNNAYNQDNETSWVDWERVSAFADLEHFVRRLLALRHRHPVLSQPEFWGDGVRWFGVDGPPDAQSRSLAWHVGDLYAIANAWWEPLPCTIEVPGPWRRVIDTSRPSPDDAVDHSPPAAATYVVGPRSIVVLERP
jgi:glycogen operon protein